MASVEIIGQTVRSQAEDAFETGCSLADRGVVYAVTVEGVHVGAHVENPGWPAAILAELAAGDLTRGGHPPAGGGPGRRMLRR